MDGGQLIADAKAAREAQKVEAAAKKAAKEAKKQKEAAKLAKARK